MLLALLIPQAHGGGLYFDHNNRGTTIYTFFRFLPLYIGIQAQKKSKKAKAYLDSLCEGQNPQLQRYREGRTLHYTVLKNTPTL